MGMGPDVLVDSDLLSASRKGGESFKNPSGLSHDEMPSVAGAQLKQSDIVNPTYHSWPIVVRVGMEWESGEETLRQIVIVSRTDDDAELQKLSELDEIILSVVQWDPGDVLYDVVSHYTLGQWAMETLRTAVLRRDVESDRVKRKN